MQRLATHKEDDRMKSFMTMLFCFGLAAFFVMHKSSLGLLIAIPFFAYGCYMAKLLIKATREVIKERKDEM